MGTPEFAVPSLEILLHNNYEVVGVVTSTDKWGGRGNKKRMESAVKKCALSNNIPILQPKNLKDPYFIKDLKDLNANLQVVVAFRMLPEVVWNMPEFGTFNLHGSLLPKYRGAAPINWAIIKGEKETGVTTFFIRHEIDTGDIVIQEKMPIGENETAGEIHDKMMHLGAETVLKTVNLIDLNMMELNRQNHSLATKAPKIFHETCEIDFYQEASHVHNFIRGLSPYPAAWTVLDGKKLKLFKTTKEISAHENNPGAIITDNKHSLKIATKDGYVHILELQLQGRKRMDVKAFLNGYSITQE
ncbi:MAG: methionyl-tRNA formyltransferase [Bacteroidetes bacterium]|nr:methionyl-tRNA formyltransferase [Bacteroidota bacterium]